MQKAWKVASHQQVDLKIKSTQWICFDKTKENSNKAVIKISKCRNRKRATCDKMWTEKAIESAGIIFLPFEM